MSLSTSAAGVAAGIAGLILLVGAVATPASAGVTDLNLLPASGVQRQALVQLLNDDPQSEGPIRARCVTVRAAASDRALFTWWFSAYANNHPRECHVWEGGSGIYRLKAGKPSRAGWIDWSDYESGGVACWNFRRISPEALADFGCDVVR